MFFGHDAITIFPPFLVFHTALSVLHCFLFLLYECLTIFSPTIAVSVKPLDTVATFHKALSLNSSAQHLHSSAKEISKRFHILDTSENIVQRWRIKLSRLRFVCFRFVLRNRIVDLFRRTFLSKRSLFLFEKIYEEPLSHAKPITFFALSSRWSTKVGKAEKWTLSLE